MKTIERSVVAYGEGGGINKLAIQIFREVNPHSGAGHSKLRQTLRRYNSKTEF
jgi:hypothetical protein